MKALTPWLEVFDNAPELLFMLAFAAVLGALALLELYVSRRSRAR